MHCLRYFSIQTLSDESFSGVCDGRNHINGIGNFWDQAKRVLRKYHGLPVHYFHEFFKEEELQFNYGSHHHHFVTTEKVV